MPPSPAEPTAAPEWTELTAGVPFISDLGDRPPLLPLAGASLRLPRFAAWAPTDDGHRIVEVSDDLARLKAAHGVPDERVLRVRMEA